MVNPPLFAGIDDGYFATKAVINGRPCSLKSRVRSGTATKIALLDGSDRGVSEFVTGGQHYTVGSSESDNLRSAEYPTSAFNRVLVQAALVKGGAAGRDVHLTTGLPVDQFFVAASTKRNERLIEAKTQNMMTGVGLADGSDPARVVKHSVMAEGMAAWYAYILKESVDGNGEPNGCHRIKSRLGESIALIDIGGKTTEIVVIEDRAIVRTASCSIDCGIHDVYDLLATRLESEFGMGALTLEKLDEVYKSGIMKLDGKNRNVIHHVDGARNEVAARLREHIQNRLGSKGRSLDVVRFIGGGTSELKKQLSELYAHQSFAEDPVFENARGNYLVGRYIEAGSN